MREETFCNIAGFLQAVRHLNCQDAIHVMDIFKNTLIGSKVKTCHILYKWCPILALEEHDWAPLDYTKVLNLHLARIFH